MHSHSSFLGGWASCGVWIKLLLQTPDSSNTPTISKPSMASLRKEVQSSWRSITLFCTNIVTDSPAFPKSPLWPNDYSQTHVSRLEPVAQSGHPYPIPRTNLPCFTCSKHHPILTIHAATYLTNPVKLGNQVL